MPLEQIAEVIAGLRQSLENPPGSIEGFRQNFVDLSSDFPMIEDVTRVRVEIDGVEGAFFDLEGGDKDKVILYLHGGGYVVGSIDTYAALMARLAAASQCRVLGVEYRLAPEHRFPAGLDDCVAAYRWLLGQVDPGKIVIGGDSAGGGMTMAVLLRIREEGLPMPAGAFLISPWVDLSASGESMETKAEADPMIQKMGTLACAHIYTKGTGIDHPHASPLLAELHGLPPMLIQVGTSETLLDDSTRLAARIQEAGGEVELEQWPEMIHVWHIFAHLLDEGKEAIEKIGAFTRAIMKL